MKLLEENVGKTFFDTNHTYVFLGQSLKAMEIKAKKKKKKKKKKRTKTKKQMGPNQIYKLLYSKGNHKQSERQPTD